MIDIAAIKDTTSLDQLGRKEGQWDRSVFRGSEQAAVHPAQDWRIIGMEKGLIAFDAVSSEGLENAAFPILSDSVPGEPAPVHRDIDAGRKRLYKS